MEKTCTTCLTAKHIDEFHKAARGQYGRVSKCKACTAQYAKDNKDRVNEVSLARYHRLQEPKRIKKEQELKQRLASPIKRCCRCKIEKPKTEFNKSKTTLDGLYRLCRECKRLDSAATRERNPEKAKQSTKNWADRNPEKVRLKRERWYADNPERAAELARRWRENNKERAKEVGRNSNRKRLKNPTYKVMNSVSNHIRFALKGGKAGSTWERYVDYSVQELLEHLEKQFTAGMTWENYGDWHIDHIIPVSSFCFEGSGVDEVRSCWALSNLRPLWAKENISKSAKRLFLI